MICLKFVSIIRSLFARDIRAGSRATAIESDRNRDRTVRTKAKYYVWVTAGFIQPAFEERSLQLNANGYIAILTSWLLCYTFSRFTFIEERSSAVNRASDHGTPGSKHLQPSRTLGKFVRPTLLYVTWLYECVLTVRDIDARVI